MSNKRCASYRRNFETFLSYTFFSQLLSVPLYIEYLRLKVTRVIRVAQTNLCEVFGTFLEKVDEEEEEEEENCTEKVTSHELNERVPSGHD